MFYAEHESKRCGSDWTIISRHHKTGKGFIRNLLNSRYLKPGNWTVYQCGDNGQLYADQSTHRVVGKFHKVKD